MQFTSIKEKIKEKNNKGITLIALVVTIIVLLILAGVSIITLTGENGIITRASGAKTAVENSSVREKVQLAVMAGMSNRDLRVDEEMLEDSLTKSFGAKGTGYTIEGNSTDGWTVTVGELSYKVTSTGGMEEVQPSNPPANPADVTPVAIAKLTTNLDSTVVDTNGYTKSNTKVTDTTTGTAQTLWVPQDFKILTGTDPITNQSYPTQVSQGIVVEDKNGNQFVWVPVPDVIWDGTTPIASGTYTPMAATYTYDNSSLAGDANYSTLYRGLLYEFSGTTATSKKDDYNVGTTSYREPSLVTGNNGVKWAPMAIASGQTDVAGSSYDRANFANAGSFATASAFGTQMQKDYNDMIASVNTYGGFYVGRFETGIETKSGDSTYKKFVSKKAGTVDTLTVTTADASTSLGNTWYGLYKEQKAFSTSGKVRSSMIWGSQYDAMMNWMAKTGKTVGTKDDSKYNTNTTTGSKTEDIINNVFDLYGCHFEWTLEASQTAYRAFRGGCFSYSLDEDGHAPAIRIVDSPTLNIEDTGSRLTLYIVD